MSSEWTSCLLENVLEVKYGKDHKKLGQGAIPVYGSGGVMRYADAALYDDESILIPRKGSLNNVLFENKPFWTVDTMFWSKIDKTRAFPKFLYYQLSLIDFMSLSIGSAVPSMTVPVLNALEITLPPLNEQKSIADALSILDDRISLLRETNTTLEAIAQALFKSWFVDFDPVRANMARRSREGGNPEFGGVSSALDSRLRGNDETGMDAATAALFPDSFEASELGEVPKGWRVGTLGGLTEFQNGYSFKSKNWVDSGHPVVKIGDVKPGIIDLAGCSFVAPATTAGLERFRLERGDLLVGMTGYVGETGLVSAVEPSAYLNQRVGRFSTPQGFAGLGYVYCLVRNQAFKIFAEAQSHGSAQANVSGTALLAYPCVLPTTTVMTQFNETIYALLKSILSNHEQAQTLATLRDTLLPRLISGQLRLPE